MAASCAFGTASCSDEDEPDTGTDAAADTTTDRRPDVSSGTDARSDTRADTGTTADVRADTGSDGGMPEGGNCVGGGDAARDGVSGMLAVQMLRCANCHQDEPADAGIILSGRMSTLVGDAGVFPPNLTPDPATGLGCWTDQQIVSAIMDGIDEKGMTLCNRMPLFRNQIDAGTAQEIVNFLRTIPAVNKAIPETTSCPPRPPQPDGGRDAASDADGGAPPTEGGTDGEGPDAGTDAGADAAPPPDAGSDALPPDGAIDSAAPDGAAPDSATPDSAAPDGAIDVGNDAETDAGSADVDGDADIDAGD